MNYSAQQITHVYKKVKTQTSEHLAALKYINPESIYGDFVLNVADVFKEHGPETLRYKYVGYGGVRFMGNINDKVPTQGLYYKDANIQFETEKLIRFMTMLHAYKLGAVKYIAEQHGSPKPQHAILWQIA